MDSVRRKMKNFKVSEEEWDRFRRLSAGVGMPRDFSLVVRYALEKLYAEQYRDNRLVPGFADAHAPPAPHPDFHQQWLAHLTAGGTTARQLPGQVGSNGAPAVPTEFASTDTAAKPRKKAAAKATKAKPPAKRAPQKKGGKT